MITCSTCTHSLTAQSNFCPNCGTASKIPETSVATTASVQPNLVNASANANSCTDNIQNIEAISEGLQKIILAEVLENLNINLFDAFRLPYKEFDEYMKELNSLMEKNDEIEALIAKLTKDNSDQEKLDRLTKEHSVTQHHLKEFLQKFYSQQQVSSIKKNFEFVIITLGNWPVQTLQKIFDSHFIPAHPSLQNHFPSESQCHSETTQIQMGIRKQLAEFLYELNELQILEQKLEHLAPQLRKVWYQNDDTDWEDIAKYARAGAMAVINPFVGIPFLAGKIFSDYKQETKVSETNTDFLSKWEELFNQYAEKWGHINEIFCAVQENLTLYIQDKSKRIVVGGTIHLLKIADKQGEQIKTPDHYFGSN